MFYAFKQTAELQGSSGLHFLGIGITIHITMPYLFINAENLNSGPDSFSKHFTDGASY